MLRASSVLEGRITSLVPPRQSIPNIKDFGVIGDCRSAALVSRNGSVDWLCWPQFDSDPFFSALVDRERGGCWLITPTEPFEAHQSYIPDTNVLQTTWRTQSGSAILTDVVPVLSEEAKRKELIADHELTRELVCTEGEMEVNILFHPRNAYASRPVKMHEVGRMGLRVSVGEGVYWLRSGVSLQVEEDRAHARLKLKRGQRLQFSLTYSEESPAVLPLLGDHLQRRIDLSIRWWKEWAQRCSYQGPYRDAVVRSALALKLLTYAPSGAVVAAVTTSLPEIVGAELKWDSRYCWLRDASLTIRALLGLGYLDEAQSFLTWLLHTTHITQPRLNIMYDVFGKMVPRERDLHGLSGYRNSKPVRIGNGARKQLQLDIYGEVIDAASQFVRVFGGLDRTTQDVLLSLGKYVASEWDQPDEGIWEPRSGRRNNTHSRLMCWTALERLLQMHKAGVQKKLPVERFTRERDRIRSQIEAQAWNSELDSYVSILKGDSVDATLLRIPWYGFAKADTPRMKSTYRRVRSELGAGGSLMYRYPREPQEGAFGICGFWGAEYLAIGGGTLQEAHSCFEHLLQYRNELGLFSEEIDPVTGDALGNFPQAFTHVGLISAALSIDEREQGEPHPAERQHTHSAQGVAR
jgi:GH15 family glucan-1,4-alpha-glucosidase